MDEEHLRRSPEELHDDCTGVTDKLATNLTQVRAQLEYVNGELDRCMIERHELAKKSGALIRYCLTLGYESGQGITATQFIIDYVTQLRASLIKLHRDMDQLAGGQSTTARGQSTIVGAMAAAVAKRIESELWGRGNSDV